MTFYFKSLLEFYSHSTWVVLFKSSSIHSGLCLRECDSSKEKKIQWNVQAQVDLIVFNLICILSFVSSRKFVDLHCLVSHFFKLIQKFIIVTL